MNSETTLARMLALVLALVVSQTRPVPSPQAVERFEAEREVLLQTLVAANSCDKPRVRSELFCDIAQSPSRGSAADLRGNNTWVGVSWLVTRGKGNKPTVSAPWLSAMALNKDSVGVWGAVTDITPQNASEQRELARITKSYEDFLRGHKADMKTPDALRPLLNRWSRSADHLVEKKNDAWVFKGASAAVRKVGERWVLIGMPKKEGGVLVTVFVP